MTQFAHALRTEKARNAKSASALDWIPLLVLSVAAFAFCGRLAPWAFMWVLSIAIFFGCKWQSWWEQRFIGGSSWARNSGFLFAWPSMDAATFLAPKKQATPIDPKEWFWALAKTAAGAALLWAAAVHAKAGSALLGWIGMLGIILFLHFGTFHILSLLWRCAGVDAPPIMQSPLAATSLSDFWGRRWNLGFRQLTHRLVFTPVRRSMGTPAAILLSFLASGLIHDLVISLPARGGYGLPTLYFLIQGVGVLIERSAAGTKCGIQSGIRGRLFALVCVGAPAYFLFHPWFVHRVILPFLVVLGGRQ
jgi:hypothetical protein